MSKLKYGRFISRYLLEDLLANEANPEYQRGITLYGGNDDWIVDGKSLANVLIWAKEKMQLQTTEFTSLYTELKAAGIEMTNHESDLYVPITEQTKAIIKKYPLEASNATRFKSNIDNKTMMFDIPFAYTPFWEKKQAAGKTGGVQADTTSHRTAKKPPL